MQTHGAVLAAADQRAQLGAERERGHHAPVRAPLLCWPTPEGQHVKSYRVLGACISANLDDQQQLTVPGQSAGVAVHGKV